MTVPSPKNPRFTSIADHALLVEFGEAISDPAHEAVLRLDRALTEANLAGVRETIPAYVNVLIDFDPIETDHASLKAAVETLIKTAKAVALTPAIREVLVCYEGEFAPDLAEVAKRTGLTAEAVIQAHLSGDYQVAMYGFAPGYAYLAGTPRDIQLDRKPAPVRGIEAGAVMIAGPQCLVTTLTMPTGWWIIGQSPTKVLSPLSERPFLFDIGDKIRFRRISRDEYLAAKDRG